MDHTSKNDEDVPSFVHVQSHHDDEKVDHRHPVATTKDDVMPIEQEAVENVAHIHLSWRSWARSHPPPIRSDDPFANHHSM